MPHPALTYLDRCLLRAARLILPPDQPQRLTPAQLAARRVEYNRRAYAKRRERRGDALPS